MNPKNERLIRSALAAGAVCIALASLELWLAFFHPQKITAKPYFHIQSFFCRYHPILGWENVPNYRDVVRVDDSFFFTVTHNTAGQRGREHSYKKRAGVYRVLVMGDSFAWGFGVNDEEVFSAVMESATPGLEVVNCGVSGYGTDQELLYYMEECAKYEHDLVVLVFYANDLAEIATSISYGYPKPMFVPDANPITVGNVPVPKTTETERKLYGNPATLFGKTKRFLRRNTHTYPFIAGRLNSIPKLRRLFLKAGLAEDFDRGLAGVELHRIQDAKKRWELLFMLLKEFHNAADKNRAQFLLVNIPIQETPKTGALPGMAGSEREENDAMQLALGSYVREQGIPFLDLLAPLREGGGGGLRYYSDRERDIHLNDEGHRLLARLLLERIKTYDGNGKK